MYYNFLVVWLYVCDNKKGNENIKRNLLQMGEKNVWMVHMVYGCIYCLYWFQMLPYNSDSDGIFLVLFHLLEL